MNRDEAKQLLPIMQAYVDGKDIEVYNPNSRSWEYVINPSFTIAFEYRIKPHTEKVTYRLGLYRSTLDKTVRMIVAHNAADVRKIESWSFFIRWINPDFITEEMEI